jgi:serine/threonine-protein kinase
MPADSSSSIPPDGSLGQPRKRRGKRSLATLLRERGVLSTPHAVEVALDICDALAPAHANGVVHGQLGLGCVRLAFTPEGGPREVEIFTLTSGTDESGAVQAPPAFIEPDRVGGAPAVVDARTDIWALGALLYAMLVGKSPPAGEVTLPADSASRSLASVVESCLAGDRDHRPPSVDDLAERIASFATWPPDQFARLAKRRERRENAERVRQHRERHGLGNIPNVLDKLDDAALARAQRETTAAMSSVLHTKTTEAAMERLMTAVHEGTDAARIELANGLPALVDFDDEDEVVLPTRVTTEGDVSPLAPVACPITAPVVMPEVAAALAPVAPPAAPAIAEPRPARRLLGPALDALSIVLSAGFAGYALSATASAPPALTPTPTPPATPTASPPAHPTATAAAIPVFTPSSLPEAPPITPAALPEAKR